MVVLPLASGSPKRAQGSARTWKRKTYARSEFLLVLTRSGCSNSDIACEDYGLLLSLLAGQKSPARPLTGSPVKVSTCARTSRLPGGCPRPPTHRSRSPVPESLHRPSRATWILATAGAGIRFNEHLEFDDGETVFRHACKLGLEGIVSKRKDLSYRSGRSQHFEARRPTHQCHWRTYRASRNSASSI